MVAPLSFRWDAVFDLVPLAAHEADLAVSFEVLLGVADLMFPLRSTEGFALVDARNIVHAQGRVDG